MAAAYFADTSFWIAISSRRDQFHARALSWSRHVVRTQAALITTEAVLFEWLNALSDPATRGTAAEGYRRCYRDPQVEVVGFRDDFVESAVKLYEARPDKTWSLTDCFSFVVMYQRALTNALTTDNHFQQAGLRAILLENPPDT